MVVKLVRVEPLEHYSTVLAAIATRFFVDPERHLLVDDADHGFYADDGTERFVDRFPPGGDLFFLLECELAAASLAEVQRSSDGLRSLKLRLALAGDGRGAKTIELDPTTVSVGELTARALALFASDESPRSFDLVSPLLGKLARKVNVCEFFLPEFARLIVTPKTSEPGLRRVPAPASSSSAPSHHHLQVHGGGGSGGGGSSSGAAPGVGGKAADELSFVALVEAFRAGVPITTIKVRFRRYRNVFLGSAAVDWLLASGRVASRAAAVALGEELHSSGVFDHVMGAHIGFTDESQPYRFRTVEVAGAAPQSLADLLASYIPNCVASGSAAAAAAMASLHSVVGPNSPGRIGTQAAAGAMGSVDFYGIAMLCDISGFTALTEKLTAEPNGLELLVSFLNAYFGKLCAVVHNHGGDIMRFAGDALLAVWGMPPYPGSGHTRETRKSLALRAAQCALEIREAMNENPNVLGSAALASWVAASPPRLHIALADGDFVVLFVGGLARAECLLAGEPLAGLDELLNAASPDQAVAPASMGLALKGLVKTAAVGGTDFVRLVGIAKPVAPEPLVLPRLGHSAEPILRAYVPGVILRTAASFAQYRQRAAMVAEVRVVSVAFVSVRGLAVRSSSDAARVSKAVNAILSETDRFSGALNKVLFDDKGFVALIGFGLPSCSHEDDSVRALLVGHAIAERLAAQSMACAVGVATGPVFCGVVGCEQRREYTMIGDAVNLAARLMGHGAGAGLAVCCDEATSTAASASRYLELAEAGSLTLKGKQKAIVLFTSRTRVDGFAAALGPLRALLGLIGREPQLDELRARLAKGLGGVLLYEAPPGAGKTALLCEISAAAATAKARPIVWGSGRLFDAGDCWHPWRPALRACLGLAELEPTAAASRVCGWLESTWRLLKFVALLGPPLGLTFDENDFTLAIADPAVRTQETIRVLLEVLSLRWAADSAVTPRLVLLDDLNALPPQSGEMLAAFVARFPAILVVASSRAMADPQPKWYEAVAAANKSKAPVCPLSVVDVAMMSARRLSVSAVPPAFAVALFEKTGGNPLFVMHLLQSGPDPSPRPVFVLPLSLRSMLTSRLDALTPSQVLTLKVAAVLGMHFSTDALARAASGLLVDVGDGRLESDLEALVHADLLASSSKPSHSAEREAAAAAAAKAALEGVAAAAKAGAGAESVSRPRLRTQSELGAAVYDLAMADSDDCFHFATSLIRDTALELLLSGQRAAIERVVDTEGLRTANADSYLSDQALRTLVTTALSEGTTETGMQWMEACVRFVADLVAQDPARTDRIALLLKLHRAIGRGHPNDERACEHLRHLLTLFGEAPGPAGQSRGELLFRVRQHEQTHAVEADANRLVVGSEVPTVVVEVGSGDASSLNSSSATVSSVGASGSGPGNINRAGSANGRLGGRSQSTSPRVKSLGVDVALTFAAELDSAATMGARSQSGELGSAQSPRESGPVSSVSAPSVAAESPFECSRAILAALKDASVPRLRAAVVAMGSAIKALGPMDAPVSDALQALLLAARVAITADSVAGDSADAIRSATAKVLEALRQRQPAAAPVAIAPSSTATAAAAPSLLTVDLLEKVDAVTAAALARNIDSVRLALVDLGRQVAKMSTDEKTREAVRVLVALGRQLSSGGSQWKEVVDAAHLLALDICHGGA